MSSSIKHIAVVTYNPQWPLIFEQEAALIRHALKDNCLEIHHVGSTAVPGLKAKPIIDMLVITQNPHHAIPSLEALGFAYKGELNIPFRFYFGRPTGTAVNLHLYEEGHPEIELNLMFRDYLRTHPEVRDAYAALKAALLQNQDSFKKKAITLRGTPWVRNLSSVKCFKRRGLIACVL